MLVLDDPERGFRREVVPTPREVHRYLVRYRATSVESPDTHYKGILQGKNSIMEETVFSADRTTMRFADVNLLADYQLRHGRLRRDAEFGPQHLAFILLS